MRTRHLLGGVVLSALLLACGNPVAQLTDGGASNTGTGGTAGTAGSTNGTGNGSGTGGATSSSGGAGSTGGATNGSTGESGGSTGNVGGTGGTTGDGGLLNQPCSIDQMMDPCVAVGLVCMYSTDPAHMGTICVLPGEFSPCQVSIGCNDASLQCLSFATGSFCLRPCVGTSDCPTLYTSCQPAGSGSVCYFNFCTETGDGGTFSSCDASGQGDGTCLPTAGGAVCLQGGSSGLGGDCNDHRGPGITEADICVPNAFCIPGGVPGGGHCAPLCGLLDGGTSCPYPTFCQASAAGDWGYCL